MTGDGVSDFVSGGWGMGRRVQHGAESAAQILNFRKIWTVFI
jgi:hypothetical protein